jgi:cytochrome c biogenesis protein CcmG/thiol:disulfide interchange protein DsbE
MDATFVRRPTVLPELRYVAPNEKRHTMPSRFIVALVVALACASLGGTSALARRHASTPSTGLPGIRYAQVAPDFPIDAAGGPRTLATLFGRPVVVNFWASWCEPCRDEVAVFATLRKTYGDAVPLVTISEDQVPGAAAAYLTAHGVDAIAIDDPDRKIFARYTITPIPVTLILAPNGAVTHVSVGELDWAELQGAVAAVMAPASTLTLGHGSDTLSSNAGTRGP